MTKEQQMQVRKLHEQQGMKPAVNQSSEGARIAALEAQLGISSQQGGRCQEEMWRNHKQPASGGNRGNLLARHRVANASNPADF